MKRINNLETRIHKTLVRIVLLVLIMLFVVNTVGCMKSERFIKIDQNSFPDDSFRMYVEQHIKSSDGKVSESQISAINTLELNGVDNYKGLEYFTNIESIELNGCSFSEISFSNNTKLRRIKFNKKCCVKKIDVSCNLELEELYCSNIGLEELILPEGDKLEHIFCSDNALSTIDVTGCKGLLDLDIYNNSFKEIDISHCLNLRYFICWKNDLSKLDITNCPKLKKLAQKKTVENATKGNVTNYRNGLDALEYDAGTELIW